MLLWKVHLLSPRKTTLSETKPFLTLLRFGSKHDVDHRLPNRAASRTRGANMLSEKAIPSRRHAGGCRLSLVLCANFIEHEEQRLDAFHPVKFHCRPKRLPPRTVLQIAASFLPARDNIFVKSICLNRGGMGGLTKPRYKPFVAPLKAAPLTFRSSGEGSPGTQNTRSKIRFPASPLGPSPETPSADTCSRIGQIGPWRIRNWLASALHLSGF